MRCESFAAILDLICPMFVLLDAAGQIERTGPTLQKLRPGAPMQGRRFLEIFELNRPRAVRTMEELMERSGVKLHLKFRDAPQTALKGLIVPRPERRGAIVNLSFGISVPDAVRDYSLNSADFAATDLTIELLYLAEAKSAAMEASRKLNLRLQEAMIAAEEQAYTDTLTGLRNRRALDFVLAQKAAAGTPFSLMHVDLDYFKQVNDTMGHAAGDHVLQAAARVMRAEIRGTDTVARTGGDEFMMVMDRLTDEKRLAGIARRLIRRIGDPFCFQGQSGAISASIGTVIVDQPGSMTAEQIMSRSDLALYSAKNAGRSCHRFYSPSFEAGGTTAFPGGGGGPG